MNRSTDSGAQKEAGGNAEADIADILSIDIATRNRVIALWDQREPITNISEATGLTNKDVCRILKDAQKKFFRKKGERHEQQ